MYEDLKDALMTRLMAVTPLWSTRIEGKPFTPKADTAYQEAYLIETAPLRPAYGFGTTNFPTFIYQVNLYYPVSKHETQTLIRRADLVAKAFYPAHGRGDVIPFGNNSATFDWKPKLGPLFESGVYFKQVLDIPFFCQINPS